ncbi:MAG: 30S ribosome-binding factor RbfA [Flavobacteriales bacterium]
MATRRKARLESLFLEEVGQIFMEQGRGWFGSTLIAVSEVRFSPDLRNAKVFISLHGIAEQKQLFQKIQDQKGAIKKELGKKVRHQVRKMPELEFVLDDSIDRAARIDELLKE